MHNIKAYLESFQTIIYENNLNSNTQKEEEVKTIEYLPGKTRKIITGKK